MRDVRKDDVMAVTKAMLPRGALGTHCLMADREFGRQVTVTCLTILSVLLFEAKLILILCEITPENILREMRS